MIPLNDSHYKSNFVLSGTGLVEASAGTGKTYTIQSFFLRLIVERGLKAQQILVVTFTEAATKELRDRLRSVLNDARRYLEGIPAANDDEAREREERIKPLMELPLYPPGSMDKAQEAKERLRRVRRALLDFDEASIFTLHGFCKRALQKFAFECGYSSDAELIGASQLLIGEICEDWWRKESYHQDEGLVRLMKAIGCDPASLKMHALKYIGKPDARWKPEAASREDIKGNIAQRLQGARPEIESVCARAQFNNKNFAANVCAQGVQCAMSDLLAAIMKADWWAAANSCLAWLSAFEDSKAAGPPSKTNSWRTAVNVSNFPGRPERPDPWPSSGRRAGSAKVSHVATERSKTDPKWTSTTPWKLPEKMQSFVDSCNNFESLTRGKRKNNYSWEGGCLRHSTIKAKEIDDHVGKIQKAWSNAESEWQEICKDVKKYPRRENKDAKRIMETLANLSRWFDQVNTDTKPQPADFADRLAGLSGFNEQVPGKHEFGFYDVIGANILEISGLVRTAARRLIVKALDDVKKDYALIKRRRNTITYDDLLQDLRSALETGPSKEKALAMLREEYKAALIDEFQDTDPVQYAIFKRIFIDGGRPVFLVGDPKQAIYSFRSGDIFTYYAAAQHVKKANKDRTFMLNMNHRSETRLVDAVNQVFRDAPAADGTTRASFLNNRITYSANLEAKGKKQDAQLHTKDDDNTRPFKLWYYGDAQGRTPGQDSPGAGHIYADVAAEIVRILNDDKAKIGDRRIVPSDIAILVLTHEEAALIAAELARRNVPAVRQNIDNVFDSPEAKDLLTLLLAINEPRSSRRVRSALATALFPCTHEDLARMASGEIISSAKAHDHNDPKAGEKHAGGLKSMEDWLELFQDVHDLWRQQSFVTALNHVLRQADMRAHLVSRENGERRLTNVLQLVELTHNAIVEQRLSMEATLTWFARQMEKTAREEREDEYKMRLETDDDAVKIMTIFKSKGLQFPIVFVPTMWRRSPDGNPRNKVREYHQNPDQEDDAIAPLIINLAKEDEDATSREIREKLEEDIRLFYVAATRAIHRTYLVWGRFAGNEQDSALAWVLGVDDKLEERIIDRHARLGCKYEPAIEIIFRTLEGPADEKLYEPSQSSGQSSSSCFKTRSGHSGREPKVDKSHGHTSFSGISPAPGEAASHESERYDFDAADMPPKEPAGMEKDGKITILNFPAGAKTGECWHRILEALDFASKDRENEMRRVVSEQLGLFRLDKGKTDDVKKQKRDVVVAMVTRLLNLPLIVAEDKSFTLSGVPLQNRCAEMEFNFPLQRWGQLPGQVDERRTTLVSEVLKKHWAGEEKKQSFLKQLENWNRPVPRGFMTGFIDLVLRHGEKYYIIDWKSNRRTGEADAFCEKGLEEEMAKHSYFLQYLIYAVAVHNYLRGALKGYGYDKHFGGVFYIFLRGLGTEPGHGIYCDRPSCALVEELSNVLGDFS